MSGPSAKMMVNTMQMTCSGVPAGRSPVAGQARLAAKAVTSSAAGVSVATRVLDATDRPSIERPRTTPLHVAAMPTSNQSTASATKYSEGRPRNPGPPIR